MARSTAVVELDEDDRATLLRWSRSSSVRAGLAMRARIVLAAAYGGGSSAISARLGVSRPTVIQWRDRFLASGLEGLNAAPQSGRPKMVDDAAILAASLEPPPAKSCVYGLGSPTCDRPRRRPRAAAVRLTPAPAPGGSRSTGQAGHDHIFWFAVVISGAA